MLKLIIYFLNLIFVEGPLFNVLACCEGIKISSLQTGLWNENQILPSGVSFLPLNFCTVNCVNVLGSNCCDGTKTGDSLYFGLASSLQRSLCNEDQFVNLLSWFMFTAWSESKYLKAGSHYASNLLRPATDSCVANN